MAYRTAKEYRAAAERRLRVALENEASGCETMMRIHLKMATILEAKAIALEFATSLKYKHKAQNQYTNQ